TSRVCPQMRIKPLGLIDDEPVAMHGLDAVGAGSELVGAGARDSLADDGPVEGGELDRIALLERALARDDADREQAPAPGEDRLARAVVDDEPPRCGLRMAEPQLERARRRGGRSESRTAGFSTDDRLDHSVAATGRDHGRDPGTGGE